MVRKEKKLLRRTRINGRSWLPAYVIFLSHSFHYRCDIQYTAICNEQLTTCRRYCGCEGDNVHTGGGGSVMGSAMQCQQKYWRKVMAPRMIQKRPKIRKNAIFSGDIWLNWIRWVMIYNISYTTQLHFLPTECFARLIWCWWWNRKGGEILCKYFRKCKAGKAREGASLCCPVVWRVQQ